MVYKFSKYDRLGYSLNISNKYFYEGVTSFLDKLVTLVALFLAFPILFLVAIAIKIEDGGPIFYSQKRLGQNGSVFTIYKIRSMVVNAEINGIRWASEEDDRITHVGKFIRKTRIDEIPQLINILSGDMKLIGPRPERPELADEFYKELPEFVNRLLIKPGLTGLAQVSGGYDLTPAEKLILDVEYIENRGFLLDLKIIFKTIGVVITGEGAR